MHGEKETTHYKLFLIKSRMLMTFWHILGKWKIVNKARIKWMCKMSHWMLGIHYIVQPMMKCIELDRERVRLVKCIQMCWLLGHGRWAHTITQWHSNKRRVDIGTVKHWGDAEAGGQSRKLCERILTVSLNFITDQGQYSTAQLLQPKVKVTW